LAASVKVKWKAQPRLSAIHAAYVVAKSSRCSDSKTESAIAPSSTEINQRLLSASLDIGTFWRRLIIEAAEDRDDKTAVEIALMASGCSELQLDSMASAIVNRIRDCRTVMTNRFPKLAEQLELRGRPLIERFEAYGPGLLRAVGNFVWDNSPPKDFWPAKVEGLLIQPVLGGDGGFDADGGRFWIEAMLTDADPSVPEFLRVVYLIATASMSRYTRDMSGDASVSLPWGIATVPIVLMVASELELVRSEPLPIETACRLWHIGDATTANTLASWWNEYRKTRTALPIALKALDRLLSNNRPSIEMPSS
jgi:hypothetical protein